VRDRLEITDIANTEGRELEGEPVGFEDTAQLEIPAGLRREIERAMKKYPEKRSASIPALWAVQHKYGWCTPEGIRQAAAVMGVTPAYLESVASFYDLFHLEPVGEHQVLVCTNISCWLRGGDKMLEAFKAAAGGDDDLYVSGFECLGACDIAPMASIDERYYGPLEPDDAVDAVAALRKRGADVLPEKRLADRGAAGGERSPADKRVTKHPLNKAKAVKK
jgi:NADH-quinone oxidoreductase subunit E